MVQVMSPMSSGGSQVFLNMRAQSLHYELQMRVSVCEGDVVVHGHNR